MQYVTSMKSAWIVLALLASCSGTSSNQSNDASVPTFTGPPAQHRAAVTSCAPTTSVGNCALTTPDMGNDCTNDSECNGNSGRCLSTRGTCACSADACLADSDCQSGSVCACSTPDYTGRENRQNHCVPTNCHTDGECPAGQYCAPSLDEMCGTFLGVTRWACTTPNDTCRLDSDCASTDFAYGPAHCIFSQQLGYFSCSTAQCAG